MNRFKHWCRTPIALTVCTLAVLALAAPGCSGDPASERGSAPDAQQTGQVILPLLTQNGSTTYRLANVQIQISGPQFAFLTSNDASSETFLSANLQTGSYWAFLINWRLEKDDGTGQFQPVPATLVSSGAASFVIFNGSTSTITYQFQTDGVVVQMGTGQVKVVATVNEISAVCTPFGSGCADGTWCPPTSLTGAPLACLAAGFLAVGDRCASPTDCIAGASCVDPGTGEAPICTELCPASAAGEACSGGGTCQTVAFDYGVCRN